MRPRLKGTTIKFEPDMIGRLRDIAAAERRSVANVVNGLIERGLKAFEKDGQLFPPKEASRAKR